MNEINFRVPLTLETFHCYRKWLKEAIKSNALFVAPDAFIQQRFAVLLALNFLKLYPNTVSVILTTHETDAASYEDHCEAVGFPVSRVHKIKDEKGFRKSSSTSGLYLISTKVMTNLVTKDMVGDLDVKLFVVPDCLKAVANSGPGKLASQLTDSGKLFRVLAMCHAIPNKLAKVQSLISNLGIQNLLVKNAGDPEMGEIVFSKSTKYTEVDFVDPLVDKLRIALTIRTINLHSVKLINVCDPDSLIYSDVESWRTLAVEANPEKSDDVNLVAFLIEGYRLLLLYGIRAVYLFFSSKFQSFPILKKTLDSDSDLRDLKEALDSVAFDAFPGRSKKSELCCHPKLEYLSKIVKGMKIGKKLIVFCSSPFGARSAAEFLEASGINTVENIPDFYESMTNVDQPELIGPKKLETELILFKFTKSPESVLISTKNVGFLGIQQFDKSISMDYLVAGFRYTKFGKKTEALLTTTCERIPEQMREFDKKGISKVTFDKYSFRREKSKLVPKRPLSEFPIEYRPEVEEEEIQEPEPKVDEKRIKLYKNLRKRPISLIDEVAEECERYLRGKKFPKISNGKTMDCLYFMAHEEKTSGFESALFTSFSEPLGDLSKESLISRNRSRNSQKFIDSHFEVLGKKSKLSLKQEVSKEE